ncbi:hypothetical protein [Nonomuraea jabiensis]|uniref:Uncharacterized protein n=1 Tax=Nonomuraea jabiensis TaxID=882448 RepID=A0A7W9G162_9ACTN|nr:hypothetical protein [Nonomuraea jabiensis]MBB5775355.1 hypothetical protein [Nonomuraea jabiensis]
MDEPIVDPAASRRERRRIGGVRTLLLGRREPAPPPWMRRLLAVAAGVTGLSGALFGAAALRTDHESAGMAGLMVFLVTTLYVGLSLPEPERRGGEHHVHPAELDSQALILLARARQAILEVTDSRVHRLGLLDTVANDVVLPERLWHIACLLRTQTELRAEQAEARAELMTPELAAVLEPQQEALRRSVAAVTERVWELEVYAGHVKAADSALRAQELQRSNDRYRDLLARTGDAEGLRDLTERADTLARSLREAVEAGQTLASEVAPLVEP